MSNPNPNEDIKAFFVQTIFISDVARNTTIDLH